MTRLTDDALAELARLAGEATPGPWRTVVKGNTVQFLAIEGVCSGISPKTRNGPFIAAANPATVAALVAEVRALRAAVAAARALREAISSDNGQMWSVVQENGIAYCIGCVGAAFDSGHRDGNGAVLWGIDHDPGCGALALDAALAALDGAE